MFELTISSIILCYTEAAYHNMLSCMLLFHDISSNVETEQLGKCGTLLVGVTTHDTHYYFDCW